MGRYADLERQRPGPSSATRAKALAVLSPARALLDCGVSGQAVCLKRPSDGDDDVSPIVPGGGVDLCPIPFTSSGRHLPCIGHRDHGLGLFSSLLALRIQLDAGSHLPRMVAATCSMADASPLGLGSPWLPAETGPAYLDSPGCEIWMFIMTSSSLLTKSFEHFAIFWAPSSHWTGRESSVSLHRPGQCPSFYRYPVGNVRYPVGHEDSRRPMITDMTRGTRTSGISRTISRKGRHPRRPTTT